GSFLGSYRNQEVFTLGFGFLVWRLTAAWQCPLIMILEFNCVEVEATMTRIGAAGPHSC
ncbi:unnamed protein product, partial [Urochloa humidicola]